jgi:peptide/nickel transport system substrate-binding protein
MNMKKLHYLLSVGAVLTLAACGNNGGETTDSSDQEQASVSPEEFNEDAILNVAFPANIQTMDPHLTTNATTKNATRPIFEQLLTLNENYEVIPQLAEDYEVSEDGLVYTFNLREDVVFHNGEPLTAEDVVASMDKWIETSTQGQANLSGAEFIEVDELTVEMHLDAPSLIAPYVLADTAPYPAIVPAESVANADETGLNEYIGTGPFQFEEWVPDQHVILTRFEDYVPREEESSGLGGRKEALVSEIHLNIVTDDSTRVNGITTGEYDIALSVPLDNAEQIENAQGVHSFFAEGGTTTYVYNNAQGPFADETLRHAFNTALNSEEALISAYSNEEYFELDSALALPDQTDWYSDAGSENYNQADLDAARQLVEESDYDGEEVVILTTRDYENHYRLAVIAQQTLENIGVNATIDVYDWPTKQEVREDPANFDIFPMTFAIRTTIHQNPFLASDNGYPGWTNSPEIDALLEEITQQESFEDARPLIDELQAEVWDYLPITKVGNHVDLVAIRDNVHGYDDLIGPIFWNVGKTE